LYHYYFNTKKDENKIFWTKKFVRNFLPPIEKHALQGIFEMYGLPSINIRRQKLISSFQFVPVVDLLFLFILIKLIAKLVKY
jgi:hypothetical protein